MDIFVTVLILFLLFYLCYKGVPTPIGGLVCSALLLLYFGMDVYDGLTKTYMGGFVNFVQRFFIMFLFGSLFGKIMELTGAADSLAESILNVVGENRISLGICLVSILFVMGGISVYICLFAILPIALKLCKRANLPRAFIIGGFSLGINVGLAMPYTASATNIIPISYFGTDPGAGGLLALFCNVLFFAAGMWWLTFWENRCRRKGMGFQATPEELAADAVLGIQEEQKKPHWILALLPIVFLLIALNVFELDVLWSLLIGSASALILQFRTLPRSWGTLKGATGAVVNTAMLAAIIPAAVVGFGSIVTETPGFASLITAVQNIDGNPLIVAIVAINLFAGITGSSSAALGLAGPILQDYFLPLTNPAALHRVSSLASLGLDSLPNCGFIQAELSLVNVSFKEAYLPLIFVLTVVMTLLQAFIYAGLFTLFGVA